MISHCSCSHVLQFVWGDLLGPAQSRSTGWVRSRSWGCCLLLFLYKDWTPLLGFTELQLPDWGRTHSRLQEMADKYSAPFTHQIFKSIWMVPTGREPFIQGFPTPVGWERMKGSGVAWGGKSHSTPAPSFQEKEGASQGKHLLVCMQWLGSAKPFACGVQKGRLNISSIPSAWTPCHPPASQKHTRAHTEISTEIYLLLSLHSIPSQPHSIK